MLANVDAELAALVAENLALPTPKPAGSNGRGKGVTASSPALSLLNQPMSPKTRKVAILTAPGVKSKCVETMRAALEAEGVQAIVVAPSLGVLDAAHGEKTARRGASGDRDAVPVLFDALYIPGGAESVRTLLANGDAVHFTAETYKHYKATSSVRCEGVEMLARAGITDEAAEGLVIGENAGAISARFIDAIAKHRAWSREDVTAVSA